MDITLFTVPAAWGVYHEHKLSDEKATIAHVANNTNMTVAAIESTMNIAFEPTHLKTLSYISPEFIIKPTIEVSIHTLHVGLVPLEALGLVAFAYSYYRHIDSQLKLNQLKAISVLKQLHEDELLSPELLAAVSCSFNATQNVTFSDFLRDPFTISCHMNNVKESDEEDEEADDTNESEFIENEDSPTEKVVAVGESPIPQNNEL